MGLLQIVCLSAFLLSTVYAKGLRLEVSWSTVNFTFTPDFVQNSGPDAYDTYIYQNNVPMGAIKWKNKMFVAIPRRRGGVPSTLNYVWLNGTKRHNIPLIPYPDWKTNQMNTLDDGSPRLVSAYRMVVDDCDRLWVIDDGRIESFGPNGEIRRIQKPSVVIIDLHTDKIIKQYFFKDTDLTPLTSVSNLAVDLERSSCDDAFAYIPDMLGMGLIVYDYKKQDSWRVKHSYFYLESLSGDLKIAGMTFQWYDGIFSVALSEKHPDGYRDAYFHSLAGTHLYTVCTRILRNKTLATRSYHGNDIQVLFHKGTNGQSSISDLHKPTGVLFYALITQNALGCWNTYKRKGSSYTDVLFRDDEGFIYPSDVKVYGDEVIATSNRYPIYAYTSLNYQDTNFRVYVANVYDAIKNSICDKNPPKGAPTWS